MLSGLESFKAGFLTRCVEEGISTDEALSRVKAASDRLDAVEKQAENPFSGMANKALQSPLGQGAMNLGGNLYNKMPEGIRSVVANQALQMGGLTNQNAGSWKYPGFTPNPEGRVHVDASTTIENDDITEDRITTQTPGKAGSPWGQVARGAMTGRMPTRTFSQGSPVANQLDINMDNITGDKLIPRSASAFKAGSPWGQVARGGLNKGGSAVVDTIEKQADIPGYGILKDIISGAAGLAKPILHKGLDLGTTAALFGPLALGGAAGYGVSKMTDVDEEDVDDVKKQELIDEYKRQADRLRQSKALRAYRDRRKSSGGVYL